LTSSSIRRATNSLINVGISYLNRPQTVSPLISELSNFVFEKIDKDLINITLEAPISFYNSYILTINKLIYNNNFDFENDYEML
jgi:hypothetical protein